MNIELTALSKRDLIKWVMKKESVSAKEACDLMGTSSVEYFSNKLYRDSFSFEDIVWLFSNLGYHTVFVKDNDIIVLKADEMIKSSNPVMYARTKQAYDNKLKKKMEWVAKNVGN